MLKLSGVLLVPLLAVTIQDVATVIGIVGVFVVTVIWGPRAFKAKAAEADLRDKDRTIATLRQSNEARDERISDLEADLQSLAQRRDELQQRVVAHQKAEAILQGRYEEALKYSGANAFQILERENQRRHTELMGLVGALRDERRRE